MEHWSERSVPELADDLCGSDYTLIINLRAYGRVFYLRVR